MGVDKALQLFYGKPLIEQAIKILAGAGLQATIAGARSDLAAYAPVLTDLPGPEGQAAPLGPLSGICSALAAIEAEFAVFLPVDMPLVPPGLIRVLLDQAQMKGASVTTSTIGGFTQTFPLVLRRSTLPVLARELADGHRGCFAAGQVAAREAGETVCTLPIEFMVQAGRLADPEGVSPHLWFLNANTPEELDRAESVALQAHRVS